MRKIIRKKAISVLFAFLIMMQCSVVVFGEDGGTLPQSVLTTPISGTVSNPDLTAASGQVEVFKTLEDNGTAFVTGVTVQQDGSFAIDALDDGKYKLRAEPPFGSGYSFSKWYELQVVGGVPLTPAGETLPEISLTTSLVQITGSALDLAGNVYSTGKIKFIINPHEPNSSFDEKISCRDKNGVFEVSNLSAGNYDIYAIPDGTTDMAPCYPVSFSIDSEGNASASTIDLQFKEPQIYGSVFMPDNTTIATDSALVVFDSNNNYIMYYPGREDGKYAIGVLTDGDYKIMAGPSFQLSKNDYVESDKLFIKITDGHLATGTSPADLTLKKLTQLTTPITGTVGNPDPTAVSGNVEIARILNNDINNFEFVKNIPIQPDGSFSINAFNDGEYKLRANPEFNSGYSYSQWYVFKVVDGTPLTPEGDALPEISLTTSRVQVSGAVKDLAGNVFTDDNIMYFIDPIDKSINFDWSLICRDRDGHYEISNLPEGDFTFFVKPLNMKAMAASKTVIFNIDASGNASQSAIDMQFSEPQLSGTVLTPDGNTATSYACITLVDAAGNFIMNYPGRDDGYYVIGGLSDGNYGIIANPTDEMRNEGYKDSDKLDISISEGQVTGMTSPVDLTLNKLPSLVTPVTGTVSNPDSAPYSGNVDLFRILNNDINNLEFIMGIPVQPDGSFSIGALDDGNYKLRANPDFNTGYSFSQWYQFNVVNGTPQTPADDNLPAISLTTNRVQLSGVVKDLAGNAFTADRIRFQINPLDESANIDWSIVCRDGEGSYEIATLPAGDYTIFAKPENMQGNAPSKPFKFNIDSSGNASPSAIDLQFSEPQLWGTVLTPDGYTATPYGCISLFDDAGNYITNYPGRDDGYYIIGGLPDGNYGIVANPNDQMRNEGYEDSDKLEIAIIDGQVTGMTSPADLTLNKLPALTVPITGKVVNPDPVAVTGGVEVARILNNDINNFEFITNVPVQPDGSFSINALEDGSYKLRANPDFNTGYSFSEWHVFKVVDGTPLSTEGDPLTAISLSTGRVQVSGVVKDLAGNIFTADRIRIFTDPIDKGTNLDWSIICRDRDGHYEISNLPEGDYRLFAQPENMKGMAASETEIINISAAGNASPSAIDLQFSEPQLWGKVITSDGKTPTPYGGVAVFDIAGNFVSNYPGRDDGYYVIGGLPDGSYGIVANPTDQMRNEGYKDSDELGIIISGGKVDILTNPVDLELNKLPSLNTPITGTVINPSPAPVSGGVEIARILNNDINNFEFVTNIPVEPDGSFSINALEDGKYKLRASPENNSGYTFSQWQVFNILEGTPLTDDGDVLPEVSLRTNRVQVSGTVRDAAGKIFTADRIRYQIEPLDNSIQFDWSLVCRDRDGNYEIGNLPAGDYRLFVMPENMQGIAASKTVIFRVDSSGNASPSAIDLQFNEPQLWGSVLLSEGNTPASYGCISLFDAAGNFIANYPGRGDGYFVIGGLADGNYRISANPTDEMRNEGYKNSDELNITISGGKVTGLTSPVALYLKKPQTLVKPVTGTVTNPDPVVPTGSVEVFRVLDNNDFQFETSVFINTDGSFSINMLDDGKYKIKASPEFNSGYSFSQWYNFKVVGGVPQTLSGDPLPEISLTTSRVQVSGMLRDPSGKIVTENRIQIHIRSDVQFDGSIVCRTNNGRYEICNLPAGDYRIMASPDYVTTFAPSVDVPVYIDAEGNATDSTVDLQFTEPQVQGTILLPGGTGTAGDGWVSIFDAQDNFITDYPGREDGHYAIGGLPDGNYRISAKPSGQMWNEGYLDSEKLDISISGGKLAGRTIPVDLTLNKLAPLNTPISGTVRNPDTSIPSGQVAIFRILDNNDFTYVTNANVKEDGSFSFNALNDGVYKLRADPQFDSGYSFSQWYEFKVVGGVPMTPAGGALPEVSLTTSSVQVSGFVKDPAGNPFNSERIWFYYSPLDQSIQYDGSIVCRNNGDKFEFSNLPAGVYKVWASPDNTVKAASSKPVNFQIDAGGNGTPAAIVLQFTDPQVWGTALKPDGGYASFSSITVFDSAGNYVIDYPGKTNGMYAVGGLPDGSYSIVANPSSQLRDLGYKESNKTGIVISGGKVTNKTNPVDLTLNKVQLLKTSINGTVRNTDSGITTGQITICKVFEDGNFTYETNVSIKTDGSFVINALNDGNYKLRANPQFDSGYGTSQWFDFKVVGGVPQTTAGTALTGISLTLGRVQVSGKVRDTAGNIVNGKIKFMISAVGQIANFDSSNTLMTNGGSYQLCNLPAGDYKVSASPDYQTDMAPSKEVTIHVDSSGKATPSAIDLQFTVAQIKGTLLMPDNTIALNCSVAIYDTSDKLIKGYPARADGRYVIGDLPDGSYRIAARAYSQIYSDGFRDSDKLDITISGGKLTGKTNPVDLKLNKVADLKTPISGIAKNQDSTAAKGAVTIVRILDTGELLEINIPLAQDGSFVINALNDGRYKLRIDTPFSSGNSVSKWYEFKVVGGIPQTTAGASLPQVTLTTSRVQVTGVAKDPSGNMLNTMNINIEPVTSGITIDQSECRRFKGGLFEIGNLPAGDYKVSVLPDYSLEMAQSVAKVLHIDASGNASPSTLELKIATPQVWGTIFAPDGVTPADGAHISLSDSAGNLIMDYLGRKDGKYYAGALADGTYNIVAFPSKEMKDKGYGSSATVKITISGGKVTGTVCPLNLKLTSSLPAKGALDAPKAGQVINGTFAVKGWFLDGSGVAKIEVLVDGTVKGTATYGQARTDIGTLFPDYKNSNCGFSYSLDTTKLTNGTHSIVIKETGNDGKTTSLAAREVTVTNLIVRGSLDSPKAAQSISGTCAVKGWFLDGSGVAKIEVLVDGAVNGTAAYGSARTDIGTIYPDYKNSNCGFSYNLDTTKLTNGSHSIVIRETGNDGKTTSLAARAVTVANLPAKGSLDAPAAGKTVSGACTVKGWFLDGSGVVKIEVLVDGTVKGTATYGQARTDIGTVFPDYKNSNCGFSYSLDTTKLSNGSHSIVIRETANNGTQTSLAARSVTVTNALPAKGALDTPKAGQTVSGTCAVKGWFLDGSGVSKIEVLVDGAVKGTATYGQARTDIGSLFPDYKNNNCGFSYNLDTTKLTNGSSSIVIRETGVNGVQTSLAARTVTVSNALPAKGALDTPKAGQTVSGICAVKGWFLDGSGVSKIEVLVDGAVKGTATYGQARTDIGAVFPDYKNNNCGYSYSLDTTKLTNGSHSIVIRETGVNGVQTSLAARAVTVSNALPAKGALDTPKAGQTVSGICAVKGWFLDGSGVSKIEVLVDGAVKGTATYGQARTDIGTVFPDYKNSNCGFSYSLDTTKLSNGSHSIVIRETGVNGAQTSLAARAVTVSNALPAKGALDTPKEGSTVSGTSTVKGWFLDGSGVSKVEVLVDGAVKGTATYGQARTDIATVFPSYNNSNCGYSYSLDTTKLSNGSHSIVIRETGVNGAQTSLAARTVTVSNALPAKGALDTPKEGSTVSGTCVVRGWFLDGSGVSKVEILVDGVVKGTATYGAARTDIATVFPAYNNSNCGYSYNLDTTKLSNGSHSIVIRETGVNSAQTSLAARSVTVAN